MWKELKKFGFCIDDGQYTAGIITLFIRSKNRSAVCPYCRRHSRRVHSRYRRRLADLPADGCQVTLYVIVRKFYCDHPTCSRRVFSERFPGFVLPHRRATVRLEALWTHLGLFLGGEGGARLAREIHTPTSSDTILRLVHRIDVAPMRNLRVIGIDEWAWRKGERYGVILSDHISGRPIDLLDECTKEAVIERLKEHPTLEVITRDRLGLFADAVQQAVPQAVQVADRWHLIKNIGELMDKVLGFTSVSIPVAQVENKRSSSTTIQKTDAKTNRIKETSPTPGINASLKVYHMRTV